MSKIELGIYLETIRIGLKLSRDRVAEMVGTSRSQIMRIEKGQQEVGIMQLVRIADILHVDGNRAFELLRSELSEDDVRGIAYKDLADIFNNHKLGGDHEKPTGP
jgi:transcriptional regulator with XRE-family HTH domain